MERIVQQVVFDQPKEIRLKRTAAYARVSSGKDAMLHSLSAQVSYYNQLIQSNPDWLFCGIYADEALTGTKDNRENFQKMLAECRAGNIDLIITKSISRFARNTVTLLETVRELKDIGVDVYFEEQHIHSMSADGELMLSILASYAQEESYSASENQKWRIRRDFEQGKICSIQMLGYRRTKSGSLEIVPKEAETVRMIFSDYLSGMGKQAIANKLNEIGIKTVHGCEWTTEDIRRTLKNEKYAGNMLLQKSFRENHITKRKITNDGQLPQYFVEDSHPAIISQEEFELVQAEMIRRKSAGREYSGSSPFSSKILCSCCCGFYGAKVWHSGSKYQRTIWQCNHKFQNNEKCTTPHLYEDDIKKRFLTACEKVMEHKDVFIASCQQVIELLSDCSAIDSEMSEIQEQLFQNETNIRALITENMKNPIKLDEYTEKYNILDAERNKMKKQMLHLQKQKEKRLSRREFLKDMISEVAGGKLDISFFTESAWKILIQSVTVLEDGKLVFRFQNDVEITV